MAEAKSPMVESGAISYSWSSDILTGFLKIYRNYRIFLS